MRISVTPRGAPNSLAINDDHDHESVYDKESHLTFSGHLQPAWLGIDCLEARSLGHC